MAIDPKKITGGYLRRRLQKKIRARQWAVQKNKNAGFPPAQNALPQKPAARVLPSKKKEVFVQAVFSRRESALRAKVMNDAAAKELEPQPVGSHTTVTLLYPDGGRVSTEFVKTLKGVLTVERAFREKPLFP